METTSVHSGDELRAKHCVPCEGGIPKLTPAEAEAQLAPLSGWELNADRTRILKRWTVKNFLAGMKFFEEVARMAEAEGHHPDLHLERYRNVTVEIWTHAVGGLSENGFILAAKIDALPVELKRD